MLVVLVLSKKCSYLIVRPDILPVNAQLDQATDKLVIFSSIRNLDKIYRIYTCVRTLQATTTGPRYPFSLIQRFS